MATEILRPNAAGDETNIPSQYPASGAHWDKVDEETADEGSTYVQNTSTTTYLRDLYNLPASSGSGTINFIKVYIRCQKSPIGTVPNAKPSLKSNSTVTDGTEIDLTTSWTTYSEQWSTNPADGEAWEWSDIDALQIGLALKCNSNGTVGNARCTQVYVEVDYTPAVTEKSSSDTGSGTDAVDSLETPEAKSSSDAGSGVEGTPIQSAILAGNETGAGIEALIFRLLASVDTGTGTEVGSLLKDLFATELGWGSDSLAAKIEMPTKGGGMKLWT